MAAALAMADAVDARRRVSRRAEVAERPPGRRPQAGRDPRRARRATPWCVGVGVNVEWPEFPPELAGIADGVQPRGRPVRRPDAAARRVPRPARRAALADLARCGRRRTGRGWRRSGAACASSASDGDARRRAPSAIDDAGRARRRARRRDVLERDRRRRRRPPPHACRDHTATSEAAGRGIAGRAAISSVSTGGEPGGRRARARSGSASPSTCAIACTSRVVDERNASSASGQRRRAECAPPRSRCRARRTSSSTSARVTPSRQPARLGRCAARAVADHEHVRPGRLAQLAAGVGEDRLAGAVLVRVRERAHVLGVRDRLQPGGRAAFVARPRDRRPRRPSAADGVSVARRDDDGRRRVAPLRAQRRRARR